MKRTGVAFLLIVAVVGTTWGQMDMLPQIFRDLPPELQQGLPEEMSFTEYRQLNRNVDFFTMFMSMVIPGYGSFQVEKPGLGWTIAGIRGAGVAMMATAVALQWNHFYDLVDDATIEPEDFQRFLGNAFLFGGGVVVNGLAWAADVTLAYHIAKDEKDLVQYSYGLRATISRSQGGEPAELREERYLRRLLGQPDDPRVHDELTRGLTRFSARFPDAPFASEALYFRALIHAGESEDANALALALRSVRTYPDGPRAHDAIRLIVRVMERNHGWALDMETVSGLARLPSPDEDLEWRAHSAGALLYESVRRSGTDALTDAALEELRGFVERFPDSRLVPDSLMMIGELLAERGEPEEASSYLAVVVVAWQDHPQWAHAALRAARLYTDQRDAERATIVLRAVVERLPGSDESATATELLEELEPN